jgi:hypothetical protein
MVCRMASCEINTSVWLLWFSRQCNWRFWSSGMWQCIAGKFFFLSYASYKDASLLSCSPNIIQRRVKGSQQFKGMCCLHHQGFKVHEPLKMKATRHFTSNTASCSRRRESVGVSVALDDHSCLLNIFVTLANLQQPVHLSTVSELIYAKFSHVVQCEYAFLTECWKERWHSKSYVGLPRWVYGVKVLVHMDVMWPPGHSANTWDCLTLHGSILPSSWTLWIRGPKHVVRQFALCRPLIHTLITARGPAQYQQFFHLKCFFVMGCKAWKGFDIPG